MEQKLPNLNPNIHSETYENTQICLNPYIYKGEVAEFVPEEAIEVQFDSSVTSIRIHAFQNCKLLTNIIIPLTTEIIEDCAFAFCSSLKNITIPNSVKVIGKSAFKDCSSLANICIPKSVEFIEAYTFAGCSSLTNVHIPSSVKTIGPYAFHKCVSMINIDIPQSVCSIGENAFASCKSLPKLHIPSSVRVMSYDTFNNCPSLHIVYFSKHTRICSIKREVLPNSIKIVYSDWNELGKYILLRSLSLKERAKPRPLKLLSKVNCDLSMIQIILTSANDDIFRVVMSYLV